MNRQIMEPISALKQGIDDSVADRHPYRAMPDIEGHLTIDPEIVLKAKAFDLQIGFYYTSNAIINKEYGWNRASSVRAYVLITSGHPATLVRGDMSVYLYDLASTTGGVQNYVGLGTGSPLAGGTTSFSFDGTTAIEYFPDGMVVEYQTTGAISGKYELAAVKNSSGATHTYTYGSGAEAGLLKTITEPAGRAVTFNYQPSSPTSLVAGIEDWSGRIWSFQYDSNRNLTTFTTPIGCDTVYGYQVLPSNSPQTVINWIQDPRGFITTYQFYTAILIFCMRCKPVRLFGRGLGTPPLGVGEQICQWPSGAVITYQAGASGNATSVQWAPGYVTTLTPNGFRIQTSEQQPAGMIYSNTYDTTRWVVLESDDPLGYRTTYSYDGVGNLTNLIDATGAVWTQVFDSQRRMLARKDPLGRINTWTWDGFGQLSASQDGRGLITTYVRDVYGNATTQINSDGGIVTKQFDVLGRLIASTDPINRTTSFGYDLADNLVSVTNGNSEVTRYLYDNCLLQAVIDNLQQRTTYSYGRYENRLTAQNALGFVWTYLWDSMGYQTGTIFPDGSQTTTIYNRAKQKIADVDQLGFYTTYSYDTSGRPLVVQNARGYLTTNIWNARDIVATQDALGYFWTTTFDALDRTVAQISPLGYAQTTVFDSAGQVIATQDQLGYFTTWAFDQAGNRNSAKDANGLVTTYQYSATSERLSAVISPLGYRTTYFFDSVSQLIAVQNARGYFTSTTFDLAGRVLASIDALSAVTSYGYDGIGRRISATDPLYRTTMTSYDAASQVTANQTPMGFTWSTVWDPNGRMVEAINPLGAIVTTLYDLDSRVAAVINPLGFRTSFGYDAVGNKTSVVDARGYITTSVYDALNREVAVQDPMGYHTTNTFDPDGRNTSIIDQRNGLSTMTYSARNEILSLGNQVGLITTFGYDPTQHRTTRQFASGDVTTYSYDFDYRLTTVAYADATIVVFGYDAVSNRTTMIDVTGVTTYTLDANNRTIQEMNPGVLLVQRKFDLAGQKVGLVDPDGGIRTLMYDLDSRTTTFLFGAEFTTYTFDPINRKTATAHSSGMLKTWSYDLANQVVSVAGVPSSGSTLASFSYSYDPAGNRAGYADVTYPTLGTYMYDSKSRLLLEQSSGNWNHTATFAYDSADNLIQGRDTNFMAYSVDPAGRLVTATSGATSGTVALGTYTFDQNGNMTEITESGGTTSMVFDKENRLAAHQLESVSASYLYDGRGRKRVEMTENGISTLVWDDDDYLQSRFTPNADAAQIVLVNFPISVARNSVTQVTVSVSNIGTNTWTLASSYGIGTQAPANNNTWGVSSISLNAGDSIAPGSRKNFTVNLKAPSAVGIYPLQWQMAHAGQFFGEISDLLQVQVV